MVADDGRILEGANNLFETEEHARLRSQAQERVWNLVWMRRVVYFATVAASLHLALFPLIYQTDRAAEFATPIRIVPETIRLAGAFIPDFFNWWLNAFAANPGAFSIGAVAIGGLIAAGVRLGGQITDEMRSLWRTVAAQLPAPPNDWVYNLRTNRVYRWLIRTVKRHVMPFASAIIILYCGLTLISHLLFNAGDSAGLYCQESASPQRLKWLEKKEIAQTFKVSDLCWASGIELVEGQRYLITMKETVPWKDRTYDTEIGGFEIAELPHWADRIRMFAGVPLRRVFLRPWFRPIARIGAVGTDEYFLDPDKPTVLRQPKTDELDVKFRARRSGELFLYVNDAVIGVPGIADLFYQNNSGEARVTVQHLAR